MNHVPVSGNAVIVGSAGLFSCQLIWWRNWYGCHASISRQNIEDWRICALCPYMCHARKSQMLLKCVLTWSNWRNCWCFILIAVTSKQDSMEIVYQCLTKGAADFLVKPVRKNELKNLWQHVWRKRYRVSHVSYSCIFQHLTFCPLLYSLGLQNHKVVFATVLTVCSNCHCQLSHVHSAVKLLQCVVSSYV